MLFTASLHPSQTWLLRQLSFSSQRVTGKHILQDPLVTVSRQGWGTSTLQCLLSIAKAAPPARGAESGYIPDPLSHPSLLLLPSPAPSPSAAEPAGQQRLHLARLAHAQPPGRLPAGFPGSAGEREGGTAGLRERREFPFASLSVQRCCSCPLCSPFTATHRREAVPFPAVSQPLGTSVQVALPAPPAIPHPGLSWMRAPGCPAPLLAHLLYVTPPSLSHSRALGLVPFPR